MSNINTVQSPSWMLSENQLEPKSSPLIVGTDRFLLDISDLCVECPAFERYRVYLQEPLSPACPSRASGCDKSQSGCLKSSSPGDGWPLAWCIAAALFPQAWVACVWSSDLHFPCILSRPWRPDGLSGCKYNPWLCLADTEWWASLSARRKSDSARFVPAALRDSPR